MTTFTSMNVTVTDQSSLLQCEHNLYWLVVEAEEQEKVAAEGAYAHTEQ
ncbi:putative kinetochore protein [Venturia inaequalis]|nr:putative kinetochore protein [Venturia inaequalis]